LVRLYRQRLTELVALRMEFPLASRIDASDVVQEALIEADRRLADFLRERPLPFYLWLRRLALDRLTVARRRHLRAGMRSVHREERPLAYLSDDSMERLVSRLRARDSSPSAQAAREETRQRARAILDRLAPRDREILVLRYLEELSVREVAQVLDLSESAVKVRHMRALRRLGDRLAEDDAEDVP
jgi:RNA polymerase sigma-70 factor (ECF subfamily)